jgi:hypothetical protein
MPRERAAEKGPGRHACGQAAGQSVPQAVPGCAGPTWQTFLRGAVAGATLPSYRPARLLSFWPETLLRGYFFGRPSSTPGGR